MCTEGCLTVPSASIFWERGWGGVGWDKTGFHQHVTSEVLGC